MNAAAAAAAAACPAVAEEQRLRLDAGAIHAIDDPAEVAAIRCTAGAVWVTQAGLADDVVLEAGESFRPREDGKVVVQALTPAAAVSIERG